MSILELTGAESCKECGERAQAERDRLQTENDKLVMKLNAEHLVRQNVERENAKLRELVRYAYECAVHSSHETCDECRRMNGYCILEHRMRELGVDA